MPTPLTAGIKSPITTISAIATAIGTLFAAISDQIDGNPDTIANWDVAIPMLFAAIGLLFARDASKSSQDSGIR